MRSCLICLVALALLGTAAPATRAGDAPEKVVRKLLPRLASEERAMTKAMENDEEYDETAFEKTYDELRALDRTAVPGGTPPLDVCTALARLSGRDEDWQPLRSALEHPSAQMRMQAAEAAGRVRGAKARDLLSEAAAREKNPGVQQALYTHIAEAGDARDPTCSSVSSGGTTRRIASSALWARVRWAMPRPCGLS